LAAQASPLDLDLHHLIASAARRLAQEPRIRLLQQERAGKLVAVRKALS